ncbi:YybH family protein [Acanthopleuribacter pedis]|uniref:DUF4440 domain-containing protein n=1 Tax=Acanthopleuribacter pedis TaxID=442870 RepID=A0A8J7QQ23_9BACT|nr:nuclear transport factor 2 family protein [Acanthopleuribacter pedis]MBO1322880.1 DUF4440 domain-containing protein [Acanthopleuribacter pedis]
MNEQQNVLNAVLSMTQAFHQRDIKGVMAAYAEGAVVCFEPNQPVSDRAQIEQAFLGFFKMKPSFTYAGHQVVVSGDAAVHIAPWTMTGTGPDGAPITMRGLSVAVLKRGDDGRWYMVVDNPYGDHFETAANH